MSKFICPQCGKRMSQFSKENFGTCNGCKDKNEVRTTNEKRIRRQNLGSLVI